MSLDGDHPPRLNCLWGESQMTDRIPARIIETVDPSQPICLTPAQSGGPIHTRSFSGRFRNLRLLGGALLMLLYFGTVWLNWNGRQAVLWDLDRQQFHIFGATFWPQDFILLSAILIIAAFGLFFITVLAGRIWCGYACPQSTWTWMFMWVEKITEGDRLQRIKLDAAPWSAAKLLRRAAKHTLWLAISLATALAFVGYFTPVRELVAGLARFEIGGTTAFWLLFFTAATYINAGWLREQVCLHMCPYSRFQSVMFDADTLLVSYDTARGENQARGARAVIREPRASVTASTARCACRSAPPASISATACSWTASAVAPASTSATASWTGWVMPAACCATPPNVRSRAASPASCVRGWSAMPWR